MAAGVVMVITDRTGITLGCLLAGGIGMMLGRTRRFAYLNPIGITSTPSQIALVQVTCLECPENATHVHCAYLPPAVTSGESAWYTATRCCRAAYVLTFVSGKVYLKRYRTKTDLRWSVRLEPKVLSLLSPSDSYPTSTELESSREEQ